MFCHVSCHDNFILPSGDTRALNWDAGRRWHRAKLLSHGPAGVRESQTQQESAGLGPQAEAGAEGLQEGGGFPGSPTGRRGKSFTTSTCLRGYDNNDRWLPYVPRVQDWSLGHPHGASLDRHHRPMRCCDVLPSLLHLIDTETGRSET